MTLTLQASACAAPVAAWALLCLMQCMGLHEHGSPTSDCLLLMALSWVCIMHVYFAAAVSAAGVAGRCFGGTPAGASGLLPCSCRTSPGPRSMCCTASHLTAVRLCSQRSRACQLCLSSKTLLMSELSTCSAEPQRGTALLSPHRSLSHSQGRHGCAEEDCPKT